MRWWARTRALWAVCTAVGAVVVITLLFPVAEFYAPSVFADRLVARTPLVNVISIAPAIVWQWGVRRGHDSQHPLAARGWAVRLLDIAVGAGIALVLVLLGLALPGTALLALALPAAGGVGIALVVSVLAPAAAPIAPTVVLGVLVLTGYWGTDPSPQGWAFLLRRPEDSGVPLIDLGVLALGLVVKALEWAGARTGLAWAHRGGWS